MKTLELEKMENVEAGKFLKGACIAVGTVGIAGALGFTLVTGGFGGAVLIGAEIGCLAYEIWG